MASICKGRNERGEPCGAAPVHGSEFCVFHDPSFADKLQEARRTGGQRQRREAALAAAFNLPGIKSVPDLNRLLEIVVSDAISLDNTVARGRFLLAAIAIGAKLLEVGEQEERLKAIEAALGPRLISSEGPKKRRWGLR